MKTSTEKIIELYKIKMEAVLLNTKSDVLKEGLQSIVKLSHKLEEFETLEQEQVLTRLRQISDEMNGIGQKMKQLTEEAEIFNNETENPFGRGDKFYNN